MSAFQKIVLANGLRIILIPQADAKTATFSAHVHAGSRHETAQNSGIAHFIEHMVFKGTVAHPTSLEISRAFDDRGARHEAVTTKDTTMYRVHIGSDSLPLAIDMVHQLIAHPLFREHDIDIERRVIIEENIGDSDDPGTFAHETLDTLVYEGMTLAPSIGGTPESLANIDRCTLVSFHGEHYAPHRIVLAVSGAFDHATTLAHLERTFGSIPRHRSSIPGSMAFAEFHAPMKKDGVGTRAIFAKKDAAQAHIAIGWLGCGLGHPLENAAEAASVILGGNSSSRLMQVLRENEGLLYAASADHEQYEGAGMFSVYAEASNGSAAKVFRTLLAEIEKFREDGPTAEEVAHAKRYLRGTNALAYDDLRSRTTWYAQQTLLLSRVLTLDDYLAEVDAITVEQVRGVARVMLDPSRMSIVAVGNERSIGAVRAQVHGATIRTP